MKSRRATFAIWAWLGTSLGAAGAVLAQAPPDFSGRWQLDPARSERPAARRGDAAAADGEVLGAPFVLVIQQTASELVIDREGRRGTGRIVLALDGSESETRGPQGGLMRLTTRWRGHVLTTDGRYDVTTPQGKVAVETHEERELADNGKTLVLRTVTKLPRGEQRRTLVFVKQDPS